MGPYRPYRLGLSSTEVGFSLCPTLEPILLLSMPRAAQHHSLNGCICTALPGIDSVGQTTVRSASTWSS